MCGGSQDREQGNGHEGCGRVHVGKETGKTLTGDGGGGIHKIYEHEGSESYSG